MEVQVWRDVNRPDNPAPVEELLIIHCDAMTYSEERLLFYVKPPEGGPKRIKEAVKKYNRFKVMRP